MRLIHLQDNEIHFKTYCELWYQAQLEFNPSAAQKPKEQVIQQCEKLWENHTGQEVLLFQKNGSCIGYVLLSLEEECTPILDLPEMCARVLFFYILPQFRKQKLGTAFFKLVRQWAREKEAAFIEVELGTTNGVGQQFLQAQGMELVGKGVENRYRLVV